MPVRRTAFVLAAAACCGAPAPAGAAVEFGQSMALTPPAPDGGAGPCPGPATTCTVALVRDAAGRGAGAPSDGVLVRVRVRARSGAGGTFVPRILRPAGDGTFAPVAAGPAFALDGSGDPQAVPTRIAVRAGDLLALRGSALPGAFADATDATAVALFGEPPEWEIGGAPRPPDAAAAPGDLVLGGVLEPDADGDGFGDESQDACPVDPGRAGACVVDLGLTVDAPSFGVDGQPFVHVYAVRNAGPSPAASVEVRIPAVTGGELRAVVAPGACVADPDAGLRCAVGRLDPGVQAVVRVTLAGSAGAVVRSSASASSTVPDHAPGDETAAAATTLTQANVPPAPRVLLPVACANVIRGTGDDELLAGTAFGDRLIGGSGRDLIRGGGADDCLEGGNGGDVLDGEDGNDRLAGGDGHDRLRGGLGDDTLRGGLRNDVLIGGPGRDLLVGGVGTDRYDAGPGNDSVDARDGVRERIDCGRGLDRVRIDRRDRVRNCERVIRR